MAKTEITEEEALQMAIDHFLQQAPRNCGVMYEQYTAVAKWLQELAAFKDENPITDEFLIRNGFEKREYDYLYCDDVEEISAQCIDAEMGVWRVYVGFLESGNGDTLDICTVGQLCMFLAICRLDDIIKQFKA